MKKITKHQNEIHENLSKWLKKPLLKLVYGDIYALIHSHFAELSGLTVEIGSGIGMSSGMIPHCIRTDLFPNPWIDQVENIYRLSFKSEKVSNLFMMDVFHHLRYPGEALSEIWRILKPGGRLIIFEPCISILGAFIYGLFHAEPVAWHKRISWYAPENWNPEEVDYYAAQGNATRIFARNEYRGDLNKWKIAVIERYSSLSYIASGGYSGPQLYPLSLYMIIKRAERLFDKIPSIFASRILVVLEKKSL